MTTEVAANVATAVGTVVALLALTASVWLTKSGHKQEREFASAAADRTEAAARLTEEYTSRVVVALEALATNSELFGSSASSPPQVQWQMTHESGDLYQLTNVGSATAETVSLSTHPSLMFIAPEVQDLAPGEALQFIAARTMGTSDSTIVVTWEDADDDHHEQHWRYPLPVKQK